MKNEIIMTAKTLNRELAAARISVRRWRSKKRYATANWLVRLRSGAARTMPDGTQWDGYEHIGHYRTIAEAATAARCEAKARSTTGENSTGAAEAGGL